MYLWICGYVFLFVNKLRKKLRDNIFKNIKNSDDHNIILVQKLGKKIQSCLYDQILQTFSNLILFGIVGLVDVDFTTVLGRSETRNFSWLNECK